MGRETDGVDEMEPGRGNVIFSKWLPESTDNGISAYFKIKQKENSNYRNP